MRNPQAAASELERVVRDQGFVGALINGHVNGPYLDDKFFWLVFESAETLDVPIYPHPVLPPKRHPRRRLREPGIRGRGPQLGSVLQRLSRHVNLIGIDRVLFTTDYPYANMKAARQFLDQMPINPGEKEKIAHLQAERLLKLNDPERVAADAHSAAPQGLEEVFS